MNLSPKIDITNILVPFEAKLFYKGDNLGKISPKVAIISKKLNNLKNWQKNYQKKWPNACHVKFTQSYVQAGVVMIHTVPLGMQPLTRTLHSHI